MSANLVEAGFNSGWKKHQGLLSRNSNGLSTLFEVPGSADSDWDPEYSWLTPVAPAAIIFPAGSTMGAAYDNVALVGDYNVGQIYSLPLNATRTGFILTGGLADLVADNSTERDQVKLGSGFGGATDMDIGPDGALYVLSIGNGAIYRIRAAAGTPTPTNTATRTPTNTPTRTPTNTPTNTPTPSTVHVGDLDRSAVLQGSRWRATVTITVHDATNAPVSGAAVSGTWSGGVSASGSCTTGPAGGCGVTSPAIHKKNPSVTWTVGGVSAAGKVYQPSANHDPDGDSNGTTITVPRP